MQYSEYIQIFTYSVNIFNMSPELETAFIARPAYLATKMAFFNEHFTQCHLLQFIRYIEKGSIQQKEQSNLKM